MNSYGTKDVKESPTEQSAGTAGGACYFLRGFFGAGFAGFGDTRGSGGVPSMFRSRSSVRRLATSRGSKSSESMSLADVRKSDSTSLASVCALRLVMVGARRGW